MPNVARPALSMARSRITELLILAVFCAIFARIYYLGTEGSEFLSSQLESRALRVEEIPAKRGDLLDRKGHVLARSERTLEIWATSEVLKAYSEKNKKELSEAIGISWADIEKKLGSKKFAPLSRNLSYSTLEQLGKRKFKGIYIENSFRRTYPYGESIAPYIGIVNSDHVGVEGLERSFEKMVQGKNGKRTVVRDAKGNIVDQRGEPIPAENGKSITLTIDSHIQSLAFSAIKQAQEAHEAKSVSVVVLDPQSGDILALASTLTTDPSNFKGTFPQNPASAMVYEPGSTLKTFSIAAALELGKTNINEIFDVRKGFVRIGNRTISDSHPEKEPLTLEGVLQKSSNVGTVEVALRMTPYEMHEYYSKLGFGSKPAPSSLPSQVSGIMRKPATWKPVEQATMSYGHGIALTALQLARAYSVFARGDGMLPALRVHSEDKVSAEPVFNPKTVQLINKALIKAASEEGTAKRAQTSQYTVAGKTGTSKKIENGVYTNKYTSSFVGFAPASNPKLVIAVIVDEPRKGGYYGGLVAAPTFSNLTSSVLNYMQVSPDKLLEFNPHAKTN